MAVLVVVNCRYCEASREVPHYIAKRYSTCGSDECKAKRNADRGAAAKAANLGRKPTPEQLARQSQAQRGKKRTPEHTAAYVAARKAAGWFKDPDIGRKISEGRAAGKKPDRSGPKNPQWKGGVAKANQRGRGTRAYFDWRAAVLARAGRRCERCRSSEFVVAHHRWSWVGHPERRYDVDNGEAVCRSCHAKEHGLALNLA